MPVTLALGRLRQKGDQFEARTIWQDPVLKKQKYHLCFVAFFRTPKGAVSHEY
jgi:hypothetical protein